MQNSTKTSQILSHKPSRMQIMTHRCRGPKNRRRVAAAEDPRTVADSPMPSTQEPSSSRLCRGLKNRRRPAADEEENYTPALSSSAVRRRPSSSFLRRRSSQLLRRSSLDHLQRAHHLQTQTQFGVEDLKILTPTTHHFHTQNEFYEQCNTKYGVALFIKLIFC